MELEQSIWQISLIALIAGALIGVLAYRFFGPSIKQADKIKSELEEARKELSEYQAGVSQHFEKTGELVNELAQNYVKVYKHLAEGAQTLGAGKIFPELLEQQDRMALDIDDKPEAKTNEGPSIVSEEISENQEPVDYVVSPGSDEVSSEPSEEIPYTAEVTEPVEDAEVKEKAEKT